MSGMQSLRWPVQTEVQALAGVVLYIRVRHLVVSCTSWGLAIAQWPSVSFPSLRAVRTQPQMHAHPSLTLSCL